MNDILQQLIALSPGIAQGFRGNGHAMQAFLDSYQKTHEHLDAQARAKQMDQFSLQDRQRQITRQQEQDRIAAEQRTNAATQQQQADALQKIAIPGQLAELGGTAETPEDAKHLIETALPTLMSAFGQDTMAYGQPAVEMAQRTITARQKRQVSEFVTKALNTSFVADNPDADPEITNLPEHIVKVLGKPTAKLSELQSFAELPVGKAPKKPSEEVSLQSKDMMVGGKLTPVNFNPKTGTYTDQSGQPVTVDAVPPKPAAGDEPIAMEDVAGAATAILSGRMAPSQLSLVGGMGNRGVKFKQQVVAEVNRQNPTFNWQQAESGYQYGKSPGTQTTVRYLDNVAKTIPMLRAANQTFKRSNVRFVNDVLKSGKSQFGNVDVADFDFKATLLADEIAKVLQGGGTGSGTSDAKLKQAQALLSGSMTPAQLDTVLDAADEMLKVRRDSLTSGTFMAKPNEAPQQPTFKVGQKVRNKKTGEVREVTGVRPDGSPILGAVKQ